MKRILSAIIITLSLGLFASNNIKCEGDYPIHLQGVANDESNIWWSFTTTIVKTDLDGKVLKKVKAPNHQGDVCLVDGKLYVAVNLKKFNTEKDADSWVFIYNADDLAFIEKRKLPELCHGAGGITFANGDFYVVGGLPPTHKKNYVYQYSKEFKFIKRHVLDTGYTLYGIQTASFYDGKFYFGCYAKTVNGYKNSKNPVTIIAPSDLKSFKKSYIDTSLGMAKIGGEYYAGTDARSRKETSKYRLGGLVKIKELDRPLKVLAIGNSFTLSLHNHSDFKNAIDAANENILYAIMYIGGCPLKRHWQNIELYKKDPKATPYSIHSNFDHLFKDTRRSNIPQMLSLQDWDIVTIQQASHDSFKSETYEPYTTSIIQTIRKACPKAEIMIQQTWSYCDLLNRSQQVGAGTPAEMYTKLSAAYLKTAKAHNIRAIPTGVAVEKARKARKMNFVSPKKEDISKLKYPELPKTPTECGDVVGGLSWRKDKEGNRHFSYDSIHLNREGEYLQGCTWLKFISPEVDIVNLNYVPKDIPADKAKVLREAAAAAVAQGLK